MRGLTPHLIAEYLDQLDKRLVEERQDMGPAERATVLILGRYNMERAFVPRGGWKHLSVTFLTVHGSKGLEADFVILPRMNTGAFPSQKEDDPVLLRKRSF